jgi:transcriptional regulator with XRE-family HTH domain
MLSYGERNEVLTMIDTTKKVKHLMLEKDLNISQLAKLIETSQPNLSKKMNRNSLSVADLEKIAEATNTKLEINFVLDSGEKI